LFVIEERKYVESWRNGLTLLMIWRARYGRGGLFF